ncbi:MAG: L-rhamnose mutarotase [Paludibacter sp.]|nr:L-rhamnose mutarotase [Paludibacter sp.]
MLSESPSLGGFSGQEIIMKRFGQIIYLKPECANEYVKQHAAVWPGVLKMISDCNIQNYSIFKKDLVLFAYFEYVGTDFEGDMAKMASDSETQRWWDVVKPLMQPIETRNVGEFWADMEEIFYLSPTLSKGEGEGDCEK